MTPIEVIFLDIGGVVLQIDWQRTLDRIGFQGPAKNLVEALHSSDVYARFECGKASAEEFYQSVRAQFQVDLSDGKIFEAWCDLILGPLPGIEAIFSNYSGRIPICALSNTNFPHVNLCFPKYPILKNFDRLFLSCEMGFRKPHAEIYLHAAKAMGVRPEQALFIDDGLMNVEGARQAGFRAFQSLNDTAQTLEILRREIGF